MGELAAGSTVECAADTAGTKELLKIAQEESPRGILRRMKELDDVKQ